MNEPTTKEDLQALTERVCLLENNVLRILDNISRIVGALKVLTHTNKGYQDNDPL
jgi:uncharacterized protein (UPF0335 family)